MFEPGVVTYGFAKTISDPKNKYAISIFRDDNVQILIHFTTSRKRAGIPEELIKHGINRDANGNVTAYVFEPDVEIGDTPLGERFRFPERTIMQFEYGFLKDEDWKLQKQFDNLEVQCHLDRKEYLDLVYAMYKSNRTPMMYKSYLKRVLDEAYGMPE